MIAWTEILIPLWLQQEWEQTRITEVMESLNFKLSKTKPRNMVAKDLRSSKYRMRVVEDKRKREPKYKEHYALS
jgi:hypothetical protein